MRYAIVTEGTLTEPAYFRALVEHRDLKEVCLQPGRNPDPLNLLAEAKAFLEQAQQVWLVMDTETQANPSRQRRLRKAVELASQLGIRCGLSNPSFEYWLLLHEIDNPLAQAPTTPAQLKQRLRKLWPTHTHEPIPAERCFGKTDRLAHALRLAPKLTTETVLKRNPSTNLACLIRELLT